MKKIILPIFAICLSVISLANLDGALPENTAAPGDLTCGRAPCHNIPVNVGDSQISITFHAGDSTYMTDSIYTATVKIQNPMTARNGFQILALNENAQNIGTWLLIEPNKMKIIPGISFPNRRYVTHRAAGNLQNEWTMQWKAPATNAGKVTFYACVLSANNNGMNTGDEVYCTKTEVQYEAVVAAGEPAKEVYKVYPSLDATGFWVELPMGTDLFHFSLYNSSATLVTARKLRGGDRHFVETMGLPGGVYFLTVESGRKRSVKKMFIH